MAADRRRKPIVCPTEGAKLELVPLVPPYIESLRPYEAGRTIESVRKQYGLARIAKLASNENPLGASPKAIEAMGRTLAGLNLYPNGGLARAGVGPAPLRRLALRPARAGRRHQRKHQDRLPGQSQQPDRHHLHETPVRRVLQTCSGAREIGRESSRATTDI